MFNEDLADLKQKVKRYYDSLGKVYCPYLNCEVEFSLKGFRHMLSRGSSGEKLRSSKEQMVRLGLFKFAVKLIRITSTLQEHSSEMTWVKSNQYKSSVRKMKILTYWSFIAILNDKRIKVVVKKIGEGAPYFWSIIPHWKKKKTPVNSLKAVRS